MLKRIAITGPESTGKSWLAQNLAAYYDTVWVPEFAREYLEAKGRVYDYDDILSIAQGQKERGDALANIASELLFYDTEAFVTKIWSEVVFGRVDPWIENEIIANPYDLYLLCYPDLLWEPDPLRENPDDRMQLFELYLNELQDKSLDYVVITGKGSVRFNRAVDAVNRLLSKIG